MMRNKRLGIIMIIFIAALFLIAFLVTKAFDKPADEDSKDDGEGSAISDIFGKDEPEETEPPEPTPTFTTAPEGYFNDALIIGDSRTEGIRLCSDIPGVTYFCSVGMGVTGAFYESVEVSGLGTVTLDTLLASRQFGKVYIMLGINDIGGDIPTIASRFKTLLEKVQTAQPDAIIIIEANLRVTAGYNTYGVNNERIDQYNSLIAEYADNETIFYLDVNPLFDDGTGKALSPNLSPDGLHVPAAQYAEWANFIMEHAVVFQ